MVCNLPWRFRQCSCLASDGFFWLCLALFSCYKRHQAIANHRPSKVGLSSILPLNGISSTCQSQVCQYVSMTLSTILGERCSRAAPWLRHSLVSTSHNANETLDNQILLSRIAFNVPKGQDRRSGWCGARISILCVRLNLEGLAV